MEPSGYVLHQLDFSYVAIAIKVIANILQLEKYSQYHKFLQGRGDCFDTYCRILAAKEFVNTRLKEKGSNLRYTFMHGLMHVLDGVGGNGYLSNILTSLPMDQFYQLVHGSGLRLTEIRYGDPLDKVDILLTLPIPERLTYFQTYPWMHLPKEEQAKYYKHITQVLFKETSNAQ